MVTQFIQTVIQSSTRPSAYAQYPQLRMRHAFLYLYTLNLIILMVSLLPLIWVLPGILAQYSNSVNIVKDAVNRSYPDDAVIKIASTITLNRTGALIIPLPERGMNNAGINLMTVDTSKSLDDGIRDNSMVVLTKEHIIIHTDPDIQKAPLVIAARDLPQMTIPAQSIRSALNELQYSAAEIQKYRYLLIGIFVCVTVLVGGLLLSFFHLVQLVFMSFIVWSYGQIIHSKRSFRELYMMGIYGLTLPVLCGFVLSLSGYSFPLVFTSGFLLWMAIVVSVDTQSVTKMK